MPSWKSLALKPAGALPPNLLTRTLIVLFSVLIIALVLSTTLTSNDPDAVAPPSPETADQPIIDTGITRRIAAEVEQQQRAGAAQRRAAERETARRLIRDSLTGPALPPDESDRTTGETPETGQPVSPEEQELRQALRLEEVERHLRSLRSPPVAHTARIPSDSPNARPDTPVPPTPSLDPLSAAAIAAAGQNNQAILDALATAAPTPAADYTASPGELDIPLPDSSALPDYNNPPRLTLPPTPPGYERIYEGSFVEAVLVTQLSGAFPSPVLAHASVPFYSADRQRILIPRGSRFIGTAQPVRGQDQDSLAVGFHRLVLPDGRHVALRFQALNQAGEGALSDLANRHYFSTFLAAGAVGILSGLAALGGNPYAGGVPAFQSGIGAGGAATGQTILRRFLNRLPEVTIRAGHRLRIWFTTDTLIPITPH